MRKESRRAKIKSLKRSNRMLHTDNTRVVPRGGVRK